MQRDIYPPFTHGGAELLDRWFETGAAKALFVSTQGRQLHEALHTLPRSCVLRVRTRIEPLRVGLASFRMTLAHSELPRFTAAPRNEVGAHPGPGIDIAPSSNTGTTTRLEGMPETPIAQMFISSTTPGRCQEKLTAPRCFVSESPTNCRSAATEVRNANVTPTSTSRRSIRTRPIFSRGHCGPSPIDLELTCGLAGGEIFHDASEPDQLWAARSMLGTAICGRR